ncbi:unnamed protein product [Cyprideis torosa]|uniref:Immunoglobulin I-set domain-containing protein n=1 Tax=Cyprideis torosa TaxID=163714 RepID=A0A7R8ZRD1_9CRUS|nr:unnamed protein product [Cyprideis torosa]CAG0898622.1 unnamed protein product [Cyprideis torosa]
MAVKTGSTNSGSNYAGMSELSEASGTTVKIKDPRAQTAPEIVQFLKQVMALQNKKAEFHYRITGTPTPHITWFKEARELVPSATRDGESYLQVNDVYGKDANE